MADWATISALATGAGTMALAAATFAAVRSANRAARADDFRPQHRDLYVSADDTGFWQGALRDPRDEAFAAIQQAVAERRPLDVELLYGDHDGGQLTISRFGLATEEDDGDEWLCAVVRHWSVDGADPR